MQPSIVLEVLAAGKYVTSEKSVALDVASGSGLILIATYEEEYEPKGLIWRVAESFEVERGYTFATRGIHTGKKNGKAMFFSSRALGYMGRESKWYKNTLAHDSGCKSFDGPL